MRHADFYSVAAQLVAVAAVAIAVEIRFAEYETFRSRFASADDWVFRVLVAVFVGLACFSLGASLVALATLTDTLFLRILASAGLVSQSVLALRLWAPAVFAGMH